MSTRSKTALSLIATLIVVIGIYGLYIFRFADTRTQLVDKSTGMVTFGYDGVQGKWLFNEMPRYKLEPDGPHILHDRNSIVYVKRSPDSCYLTQQNFTSSDSFLCTASDNNVSFYFRLKPDLTDAAIYPLPDKLLAISDIEGSFQSLVSLLMGNGVVNKDLRWTFGAGHLVLNGDFVDRGTDVTQCLWLIYKLEDEAGKAGGKVHYIIGNHEQMNLQGNVKYVAPKYQELCTRLNIPYRELYGTNTELGRWLRTKNAIEKIGDLVFVHGGVGPEVAASGLSLAQMNKICRADIDKPRSQLLNTARLLLADSGILWYRGLVREHPTEDLTQKAVNDIVQRMNAKTIVVGHTIVHNVSKDYQGKVIRIDIKHTEAEPEALYINRGVYYRTNTRGTLKPL